MQEVWKVIEGSNDAYEVSNLGNVIHEHPNTGKIKEVKQGVINGNICVRLNLDNKIKTVTVKRLVAEYFLENENDYYYVININGNKSDNRAVNLEYSKNYNKQ